MVVGALIVLAFAGKTLVAGLAALNVMPRREDPELTPRNALLITRYPGADAERVRSLVTEKLEDVLDEFEEIKKLVSTSRAGISTISIELEDQKQTFDLKLPKGVTLDAIESVVLDPAHELLIWHPDYGRAPAGTIDDDPALSADTRAIYVGDYAVEGRPLTVRVVERGDRLSIVVGKGKPEKLIPAGPHRFRSDEGRIDFRVTEGRAGKLRFSSDGGRSVVAARTK